MSVSEEFGFRLESVCCQFGISFVLSLEQFGLISVSFWEDYIRTTLQEKSKNTHKHPSSRDPGNGQQTENKQTFPSEVVFV